MTSLLLTAASCRPRWQDRACLLAVGWLWLACLSVATGQQPARQLVQQLQPPPQPARVPLPGEVVRSISIRVTDGQPRFVVAARVVQEVAEQPAELRGERLGERRAAASIPLESPPEIVDYFKRTAGQYIAHIDRACQLSERQKNKLELAAMGDMSRLVREARQVCQQNSGIAVHNPHRNLTVSEDVALINRHINQGVLRDGSIFLMVLKSQLSATQLSLLARENFAEQMAVWPVELSQDQQQQLWRLMLRSHDCDVPPLLWSPAQCWALLTALPQQELVSLLGESNANSLRRWNPR